MPHGADIGRVVLILGAHALAVALLWRFRPASIGVGAAVVLFFVGREWVPRRRSVKLPETDFTALRRRAERWPSAVAERVEVVLRQADARRTRWQAWLDAAPIEDDETARRAEQLRATLNLQQAMSSRLDDALTLGAPDDPASIDRVFVALDALDRWSGR